MCGILGFWVRRADAYEEYKSNLPIATKLLAHRGPDASGSWFDRESLICLAHTRLSIIDLSDNANQPMVGPSGRSFIVFNGEIYNYLEIRRTLSADGVQFKTSGDTETVLALYEKYGIRCLDFLRGMYAFALWDASTKKLFLARDRVGKKPLYFSFCDGCFCFASEIKALKCFLPQRSLEINQRALDEYLTFGFISGNKTIYTNIHELLPGHYLVITGPELRETRVKKYWEIEWSLKGRTCFAEAVEETDRLLTEAVKLRLRADVPVGIFLSGGIDSGLVTAIASRLQDTPCITFSVGFENDPLDERPLAKMVSNKYGTRHYEILIKPDIASVLPEIVRAYDEPFADASAVPTFYVAEFASNHLKVVLNGDGGDELFCGYRRHVAANILQKMKRTGIDVPANVLATLFINRCPVPAKHRSSYGFLFRFLRGMGGSVSDRYNAWFTDGFTASEKENLYDGPFHDYANEEINSFLENFKGLDELDRMIAFDFTWSLPYDLLVKMDIASMYHSLETRSPFLDQELVEAVLHYPTCTKLRWFETKPILRKLARKYLPDDVARAPKRGFEIPLAKWLEGDLKELAEDVFFSRNNILGDRFSLSFLEKLLNKENIRLEPGRWATLIWILLMLGLWDEYCNN